MLTPEEAPVYEKLYNQADPTGAGELGPGAAVAFFRKTGLDDVTLGNVWALADTHQAGFLDRSVSVVFIHRFEADTGSCSKFSLLSSFVLSSRMAMTLTWPM